LGYLFANKLESVAAFLGHFSDVLVLGIGVPVVAYVGCRATVLARMIHYLHLRRMSPASLRTKLDGDQDIAIIDLLNFEDEDAIIGIPGAIRIDPKRLRSRSRVIMPKALEVILYSSSQREITSARVALALRRKGIPRVWILEGGLKAWIKQGLERLRSLGETVGASRFISMMEGLKIATDGDIPSLQMLRRLITALETSIKCSA
jgi:rhodanese-related sulfurtransferase